MRPTVHGFTPQTCTRLVSDSERFCGHPEQPELAPLVYRRCRDHDVTLPPRLYERLRDQSRLTMENNSLLLSKLGEISSRFSRDQIPLMVFKGPMLADLTAGLLVRPFHDLDLLVHRHKLGEATHALRSLGYAEIPTGVRHEYHRIFAHAGARGAVVVELHFGLGNSQRTIVLDAAGIWHRSGVADLAGCAVRAPDVTDHLLLTVMQLPHHDWRLRLLVDIGLIISRWHTVIGWDELLGRARAWGMWALTASTLYTLDSMFGVAVPEAVRRAIRPEGYLRRAQWHLVMETVAARLAGDTGAGACRFARLLVLDRADDIGSVLAGRIAPAHDPRIRHRALATTAWRLVESARDLPALARVLVKSMNGGSSTFPRHSSRGVHDGQR